MQHQDEGSQRRAIAASWERAKNAIILPQSYPLWAVRSDDLDALRHYDTEEDMRDHLTHPEASAEPLPIVAWLLNPGWCAGPNGEARAVLGGWTVVDYLPIISETREKAIEDAIALTLKMKEEPDAQE